MAIFGTIGQLSSISLRVHPRTTSVVVATAGPDGESQSNVLVGYVEMEVRRPTTLECLAVKLSGTQHLDMREGEGPSSSMYSVRRRCADVGQTIFDTTSSSGVGGVSAALSIEAARVRQRGSAMCCASPPSPDADGSYAEVESTECQHLTLTSFSSTAGVELAVGEYRFSFELPLPAKLLPSVESPLGRVAYQVEAVARRPGRVFHSSVSSKPVAVTVHHVPRLAAGRQNAMLLGFPSFQMLAATPLVFETSSGSGRWKLSVYSRSSRALFLGTPLKLQLYATRKGEDCEDETSLELVEFGMRLMERITHRVPGSNAATQTTEREVAAAALCPWMGAKQARPPCLAMATLPATWCCRPA